jgi:hypothetical protein
MTATYAWGNIQREVPAVGVRGNYFKGVYNGKDNRFLLHIHRRDGGCTTTTSRNFGSN